MFKSFKSISLISIFNVYVFNPGNNLSFFFFTIKVTTSKTIPKTIKITPKTDKAVYPALLPLFVVLDELSGGWGEDDGDV